MPSVRGETAVGAGAAAAWAFVRRYENWAALFPGYQGHRVISPRVSVWRVRGDVGVFSRLVEAEVEVVQETPSVRFTITGLTENFHGAGTFEVTPLDATRSTLAFTLEVRAGGPMAPMVNALLTGRLPAMLDAFAPALARRLEAGAAAS
ncbi:MAG: SRPBCC family protein [Candidatus Rokubacteria bacterium]|nr:SRPBCC family protein [Candidatus Rokubacteria bacterium]